MRVTDMRCCLVSLQLSAAAAMVCIAPFSAVSCCSHQRQLSHHPLTLVVQVWKAVGMDLTHVEFINSSEEINSRADQYWTLVMDIARKNNLKRIIRCRYMTERGGDWLGICAAWCLLICPLYDSSCSVSHMFTSALYNIAVHYCA